MRLFFQVHAPHSFFRGCAAFFSLILLFTANAWSGAWVQEPNHFSVFVSSGYYQAKDLFNRKGDRVPNRVQANPGQLLSPLVPAEYSQIDISLYMEYGLPYDFELDLSLPAYMMAEQNSSAGDYSVSGMSDMIAGLKYLWFKRPWLLSSVLVEVGIPTGNDSATATSNGGIPQALPLGDGEWDYGVRLIGSRSFQKVPFYLSADFGYRFRNIERGGDDLPWSLEGGYSFNFERKFFASISPFLNFSGVISLKDLSDQDALVFLFSTKSVTGSSPGYEIIEMRPGISLGIWDRLSCALNYSYTIDGKNAGAGWGVRGGISWQN